MRTTVECPYGYAMELGPHPETGGRPFAPLHREPIDADLADLVDEAFVGGVLADRLPAEPRELVARVTPRFAGEPYVEAVEVELVADDGAATHGRRFQAGRWSRRALTLAQALREEGRVEPAARVVSLLVAQRAEAPELRLPALAPPPIEDATLEELGVRGIGGTGGTGGTSDTGATGDGDAAIELDPERPVLINERMLEDVVCAAERAGIVETGGGTLGRLVRLPEPLPGTTTRIVTLLTASFEDERHQGSPGALAFSPEALAAAARQAEVRGRGEVVATAWHSHGWGTECGECNQSATCALPTCETVSVDDYQVVESLFPGKATVMPIVGRKLGAGGRRPVLALHAWRGGELRPIPWATYRD